MGASFPSDDVLGVDKRKSESASSSSYCSVALYVWEGDGVLEDYTSGMVCVLASSECEAWELLRQKDDTAAFSLNDWPEDRVIDPNRETRKKPKRIEQPEAFVCWGGG